MAKDSPYHAGMDLDLVAEPLSDDEGPPPPLTVSSSSEDEEGRGDPEEASNSSDSEEECTDWQSLRRQGRQQLVPKETCQPQIPK